MRESLKGCFGTPRVQSTQVSSSPTQTWVLSSPKEDNQRTSIGSPPSLASAHEASLASTNKTGILYTATDRLNWTFPDTTVYTICTPSVETVCILFNFALHASLYSFRLKSHAEAKKYTIVLEIEKPATPPFVWDHTINKPIPISLLRTYFM